MNHRYVARMPWGEKLTIAADLAQASAPILIVGDDGEESLTQYRTADARHRPHDAIMLAVRACGRDWYAQPNDSRDSDEILADLSEQIELVQ